MYVVSKFEYNGKNYIKKLNIIKNKMEYVYFEIEEGIEKEVKNPEILKELKDEFELKSKEILYKGI